MKDRMRRLAAPALLALCLVAIAQPARAWKPIMHVYLAEQALADAVDDGRVTIYRVNYDTGQVLAPVGTYTVDPELLQALRRFPQYYRAGVIGPDAYPDIATGQMCIHPGLPSDPHDAGSAPGGSNDFLEYIWTRSLDPRLTGDKRLKVRAFAAGFLTHAAGDMFGHTFINVYAGGLGNNGDWNLAGTQGRNPLRHIICEGYVAKRMPPLSDSQYEIKIDGIEDWIYSTLVDARKGTYLSERLLLFDSRKFSIPWLYSKLRDKLVADIDEYNRHLDDARNIAVNTIPTLYKRAWVDDIDSGLREWVNMNHRLAGFIMLHKPRAEGDPSGIDQSKEELRRYATLHLLSMSGAPDFVGLTINAIHEIVEAIVNFVFPPPIREFIAEIKEAILDFILVHTIGMTADQIKDYLKNPEFYFDKVMGPNSIGGQVTSLRDMNQRELHLTDTGYSNPNEHWDYHKFPAAHNTVTMSKLILVPQSEINRLLRDLGAGTRDIAGPSSRAIQATTARAAALQGGAARAILSQPVVMPVMQKLDPVAFKPPVLDLNRFNPKDPKGDAPKLPDKGKPIPVDPIRLDAGAATVTGSTTPLPPGIALSLANVMLGFDRKLDGNNQWWQNDQKLIFIYAGNYSKIFIKQTGDRTPTSTPTPPPPPVDPFVTVTVRIVRVHQIGGDIDPPFNGDADFYTKVTIAGDQRVTDAIDNRRDINPNWSFSKQVLRSMGRVPIHIEIWDEDGNLRGDDDPIDINPGAGRNLDLFYDVATGQISGSVTGRNGVMITCSGREADNAEVAFIISAR